MKNVGRGVLLAVVLSVALGLRLWALDWGFPLKYGHIDESVVLFYSLKIVDGAWNPGFYDYPGFGLYVLAGAIKIICGAGQLLGFLPPLGRLLADYIAGDSRLFLLVARGVTVVFALATVALLADMGRRRGSVWAGLGAAALLAVNPVHVLQSHYGTVDVAAAFFTLLAFDRLAVYARSGELRDGLGAAVTVGLAAAMKYYPGVLLTVPLALPFFRRVQRPFRAAGAMALGALGGFSIASPSTLAALPDFWARFTHLYPKIVGAPGTTVPFFPTLRNLFEGVGVPVFLFGLVGLVLSLRGGGVGRVLGVAWGVLFVFLGLWKHQVLHYGLGLYPLFFLMACLGFACLGRWHAALPAAAWAAAFLWSVVPTARDLGYVSRRDSRLVAGDWIRANLAPGAKILRYAHTPEFSRRDPFSVQVDFTNASLSWAGTAEAPPPGLTSFDCLVYGTFMGGGKDPVLSALRDRFRLIRSFQAVEPRFPHNPEVYVFGRP